MQRCRQTDLRARPTAGELLDIVAGVKAPPGLEMNMERFRQEYGNTFLRSRIHCVECAALSSDGHYHCDICDEGNLNLGQACLTWRPSLERAA